MIIKIIVGQQEKELSLSHFLNVCIKQQTNVKNDACSVKAMFDVEKS